MRLSRFDPRRPRPRRPQISILIPFRRDRGAPDRIEILEWIISYMRHALPGAEIIIGRDRRRGWRRRPFSKARAVNDAARRAHGDIYVILDADTYFRAEVIEACARRIRAAIDRGHPLWFVPYRRIYRLTRATSTRVLASDPLDPLVVPSPPPPEWVESTVGSGHGHRFGAMIMIVPREGFEAVGGMDPRFEGWGGEDVSFVRALDWRYGRHKTVAADVLHLWHKRIGDTHLHRMWQGQRNPGNNNALASRYSAASGDRERMFNLVAEGFRETRRRLP